MKRRYWRLGSGDRIFIASVGDRRWGGGSGEERETLDVEGDEAIRGHRLSLHFLKDRAKFAGFVFSGKAFISSHDPRRIEILKSNENMGLNQRVKEVKQQKKNKGIGSNSRGNWQPFYRFPSSIRWILESSSEEACKFSLTSFEG